MLTGPQCGCTAGVRIRGLATLLADLNRAVPKFTTDVTLFPEDKKVQKPLQEVFGIYVDSYVFIVSYFSQNTSCKPSLTDQHASTFNNFASICLRPCAGPENRRTHTGNVVKLRGG